LKRFQPQNNISKFYGNLLNTIQSKTVIFELNNEKINGNRAGNGTGTIPGISKN
jgi:hypothetical protein